MADSRTLEMLAARLHDARRITVLTGAGVSAASGVPTFRGEGGLWRQFRPETLATAAAFDRDPALVWEWYEWRRTLIARCEPNAAHAVLARWSRALGSTTVTQNVDDLHQRAGTLSLIRLHGSIWELSCRRRCAVAGARSWRDERVPLAERPPRCPHCGGPGRPAVVWFGEALDPDDLDRSVAATRCDVFVTVGTSSAVYPAAGLVHAAASAGAFTVEVNPEPTEASRLVDLAISERAEVLLPELDAKLSAIR